MSKKNKLTDNNILAFLHTPNFESADTNPSDPLTASRIVVTLDQLKAYDNNPRTTQNPKFESIMQSIENRGLDHAPNISRRPGESHYIILDGGNTRLQILNMLYLKYKELAENAQNDEERFQYGDRANRFYKLECVFKPFKTESLALAGHMSENEERGETKFIEKAIAVQKFRDIYLEEDRQLAQAEGREFDNKPLSTRALADRITKQGWTISQSYITRFDYTVDTLLPVIPNCLWAGAGGQLVVQIRKHDTAYTEFWQSTALGQSQPEKIKDIFFKVLHEFDDETIDFKGFLHDLNQQLGELLGMQSGLVMTEVESIMRGVSRDDLMALTPAEDISNVLSEYRETAPSPTLLRASLEASSRDLREPQSPAGANASIHKPGAKEKPVAAPASQKHIALTPADMKQRLIELIGELSAAYPVIILSQVADNFMSLALRPPTVFRFGDDDAAAAVWWFLFRRTTSFVGIPRDAIQAGFLDWYQDYMPLGNVLDIFLYLEQSYLDLPAHIKTTLIDIQILIDQLYASDPKTTINV